jgi:hypothetical protein
MNPVEIALLLACALLFAVTAGAAVTMRRLTVESAALQRCVDGLREQVEELARREAAREVAEATAAAGRAAAAQEADWLITSFGGGQTQEGSQGQSGSQTSPTASTQQVVSTALGEPLIKVAAFSHGVRQALREERRAHRAYQVRREYRRRRRQSRTRARSAQRRTAQ